VSPGERTGGEEPAEGFVYAATGATHTALAVVSARSLRRVVPHACIDLFADASVEDPVFDRVHRLAEASLRPKFAALATSRFARTLYLDADTLVLGDPSDVFRLLERVDLAACHAGSRNSEHIRALWREEIPDCFPQINTGVLGVRRSEATSRFFSGIDETMRREGLRVDQPVVREALWHSDLRLAILPPEYNFKQIELAAVMGHQQSAPRVLHSSDLHRQVVPGRATRLDDLFDDALLSHIARLVAADRGLNPGGTATVRPMVRLPRKRRRGLRERLGLGSRQAPHPLLHD
jgi:hypothetical protein